MPRGASPKREKEFEELKSEFKKEHRYPGRETEVAARIVNKQRASFGETKGEKAAAKQGKAPDKNLPVANFEHMTAPQATKAIGGLSKPDVRKIRAYEQKNKKRKGVLAAVEKALGG